MSEISLERPATKLAVSDAAIPDLRFFALSTVKRSLREKVSRFGAGDTKRLQLGYQRSVRQPDRHEYCSVRLLRRVRSCCAFGWWENDHHCHPIRTILRNNRCLHLEQIGTRCMQAYAAVALSGVVR